MDTDRDRIMKRAEMANAQSKFKEEVERLLNSGGFDSVNGPLHILFGVAFENIADNYLVGDRRSKFYKNLKRF